MKIKLFYKLICFSFLYIFIINCGWYKFNNPFLQSLLTKSNNPASLSTIIGSGALANLGLYQSAVNINSPCLIAIDQTGNYVYVTAESSNSVAWFSRNLSTGALTYINKYSGVNIAGATAISISPNNKQIYVSAPGANAIAWFTRNPDGSLNYIDSYSNVNIQGAISIAVSPDGEHVYVAANSAQAVAWFKRNNPDETGDLTYIDRYSNINIQWAQSVIISPDGNHAYVAAGWVQAVAWFDRDANPVSPNFGQLTYINRDVRPEIDNPITLAISPDGNHVYLASYNQNAVSWYTRDTNPLSGTFGALTYQGRDTSANIAGAFYVAISQDGNHVYVAAYGANAIAWYGRNTDSGSPTYGALTYRGRDCTTDITGTRAVTVSPDGNQVYVTGAGSNTISWYWRDK